MPISLAQLVREVRLRFEGMSQGELARSIGCSQENITAIENGRNRQPSPELLARLAQALDLAVEDVYAAIAGTLQRFLWDRTGDLDLRDPELELMFHQLDSMLEGEPKERVKAFIRFTLDEERRKRRRRAGL